MRNETITMQNEKDVKELEGLASSTEHQLKVLQDKFQSISQLSCAGSDDPHLNVLQNKHISIQAQLLQIQSLETEYDCKSIPNNKALRIALLKQVMENSVSDLKGTLQNLRSEKNNYLKKIKSLEHVQQEELHLARLQESEDDLPQKTKDFDVLNPDDEEIKTLKKKICNLKKLQITRVNQLKEFLKSYFPHVDEYTESKKSTDGAEFNERGKKKLLLAEIIEVLLNTSIKKPNDPWVKINSSMWQPHIQLLLRTRIAVRNPTIPHLIKLEKCDE